ncbi:MAG: glycosyltransferase family 39 protein [Anaerolineales bacterium]|jgi:hypothetical protein
MNIDIIEAISRDLFALGLLVFVELLAISIGRKIFRFLKIQNLSLLENLVFCSSLGMGIIAYGIFILGLSGLYRPVFMVAWLIFIGIIARKEIIEVLSRIPTWFNRSINLPKKLNFGRKILLLISLSILFFALLQALTPVWDYDGLMYHLEGPRLFLDAGRIYPLKVIYQADGPLLIEMLFALGIGLGVDIFSKLLHLFFATLLILGTFTFGRRYLGQHKGWIPASILLGIPLLIYLASYASIDIAWSLYEFLGLYAIILWVIRRESSWLVISGLMVGFALGCKYFALGYAIIMGFVIIWFSFSKGSKHLVGNILLFAVIALLLSSPWYLKNWLWTGNPVYPMYFGGPGWSQVRINRLMTYIGSFGTGHRLLDYLMLPINIFIRPDPFSTNRAEQLSILFLFAFGYPWIKHSKVLNIVALTTFFGSIFWLFGSQQIRFLMPLFPCLSVLSAAVLDTIAVKLPYARLRSALIPGLAGGMVTVSFVWSILLFMGIRPLQVVVGLESKSAFLSRVLDDYDATQYIRSNLLPKDRVLLTWDGRSYYCDGRCIPDTSGNFLWVNIVQNSSYDVLSTAQRLRAMGINYLLFNRYEVNFDFLYDLKLRNEYFDTVIFFYQRFAPACAHEVGQFKKYQLFKITCR